jgi:transcriptional regulator GlxA family with amidase domain
MIELSQSYATDGAEDRVKECLLAAIIDAFGHAPEAREHPDRIDLAWRKAEERLSEMRGIGDVAALIGLSESAFRARHRARHANSAGRHLIALRMATAERALATTNLTVETIALDVGYGYPESFFHAFRRHAGRTPSEFRKVSTRFP